MSVRRLPDPPRRSRRLVVCGVTAALLVVPGVARAGDDLSPANSLTTVTDLGGAAEGLAKELAGGAGQSTGAGGSGNVVPDTASTSGAPGAQSLDPAELQALLARLGVSPECVTAIQGDVVATLASIPATVQQLIALLGDKRTELQADPENGPALLQEALTDLLGGGAAPPTAPAGLPLLTALEDLVQDFLTVCLPQPAAGTTPPAPISTAPAAATTPPPAAAAPTSVAPVAYLGYAPTGTEGDSDDRSALALLGSVLLLTGGAAGSWMWSRRAASSRG